MHEDYANAPLRSELEYASELSDVLVEEYMNDQLYCGCNNISDEDTFDVVCFGGYFDGVVVTVHENQDDDFQIAEICSHIDDVMHEYIVSNETGIAYYNGAYSNDS